MKDPLGKYGLNIHKDTKFDVDTSLYSDMKLEKHILEGLVPPHK